MTARRTNADKRLLNILKFALLIGLVTVAYCRSEKNGADTLPDYRKMDLPQNLTDSLLTVAIPETIPSVDLKYTGMNIGFNPELHVPNWVAWELTAEETTGKEPRPVKFSADRDVDGSADPADYKNSGYDRGHMAPAADMKWDKKALNESFMMTNIVPQANSLNSGTWKRLEEKCRQWAAADSKIYIVCGPVISDKAIEFIGENRVFVPRRFFKAILSIDGDRPRAIAFVMPNGKVPGGMQQAAVSVDELERITGYDFFAALPDEIENEIEAQCDFHLWSTIK